MSRIVVVGAGVGGLAATARLAAAGHDVTVCEQAPEVGGKLGRISARGFTWDTGPSIVTMPQVLDELFADTGAPRAEVLDLQPVDPIAHYRFADGTTLDAWTDDLDLDHAVDAALGSDAATDWRRFAVRAARIWDAVEQPFLRNPLAVRRLVRRLDALRTIAPWASLRGLARRQISDPRLRQLVERYATYSGSDPRRAPAALASVVHAERAFGVWYVPGGLARVGAAIAERAAERGATIRTGADVVAITTSGGRVDGVRLADGEELAADAVVANTDATHLYGELVDTPAARRARRRLGRTTPSLSGFVLLVGLRGATPGLAHHTVLFCDDYDAEFDAIFGRSPHPVPDPTVYISTPRDATLAPPGDESMFVLVNAPRQGPVDWDGDGVAQTYATRILDVMAARGLDVRDRIAVQRHISPADLARRTRAVGGAIYGTSSNGARAAFLRPTNASPVPGLFCVGGSAHPGGGLPLVVLSAQIAARHIGPA